MTLRHAAFIGWTAIAAATALLFVLDGLRMVNFYFNWFVVILLAVSAVLVALAVALARRAGHAPPPDSRQPAQDRQVGQSNRTLNRRKEA